MFCSPETFYHHKKPEDEAQARKGKWWRRSAVPRAATQLAKSSF
jgi:hypothetical protein